VKAGAAADAAHEAADIAAQTAVVVEIRAKALAERVPSPRGGQRLRAETAIHHRLVDASKSHSWNHSPVPKSPNKQSNNQLH
jgi:hypothetical protein